MTRLHEGLDYLLYRVYIWGGIAGLVIYFGFLAFSDMPRTGREPYILTAAPVTLWILGILAYWWWVFLFKGNAELKESIRERPEGTPEISALKNWSTLHAAMAIYGGDVDGILEAAKAARRPVLIWYGMQNLFVLWILGNFWGYVYLAGDLPPHYMRVWVYGVVAIMVSFLVLTPFLLARTTKGGEAAYLAPLGLSCAEPSPAKLHMPGTGSAVLGEGATILTGNRVGRPVYIETMGKRSYTRIRAEMPPFEVHSQAGKLVAVGDAPEGVTRALRGLRKAKRWIGVEVTGGPEGIAVRRESRGQNMWLYDLWLIERLLERSVERGAYDHDPTSSMGSAEGSD